MMSFKLETWKNEIRQWQAKIHARWQQFGKREQLALTIAIPFVILFLIYQFLWSPLQEGIDTLRKKIHSQKNLLVWMEAADKSIKNASIGNIENKKTVTSPVELMGLFQKQIAYHSLKKSLTMLKQVGNDSVEVHFQKVSFDKLILFLIQMDKNTRFVISKMRVINLSSTGLVNVDLMLSIQ